MPLLEEVKETHDGLVDEPYHPGLLQAGKLGATSQSKWLIARRRSRQSKLRLGWRSIRIEDIAGSGRVKTGRRNKGQGEGWPVEGR